MPRWNSIRPGFLCNLHAARALKPLYEREVFGKKLFLFEGVARDELGKFGEIHTPSVADIFVAKVRGGAK